MARHTMKRGDLRPALVVTCSGSDGAVDLTAATSVLLFMRDQHGVLAIDGAEMTKLAQSGATLGKASYAWQVGDTAVAGDYDIEVKVVWAGDDPQTFPSAGYGAVQITPDLEP
jgi:hypothetical protein